MHIDDCVCRREKRIGTAAAGAVVDCNQRRGVPPGPTSGVPQHQLRRPVLVVPWHAAQWSRDVTRALRLPRKVKGWTLQAV